MKKISNEQLLFTIGAKDTASTVIKKVGQELKHLDQYQRELSKSTDDYGKSTNGLRTKLDVLNRQYSAAKTGLDAYKKRMQEVQDKIDKQKQKITDLTNAEGDHSKEIESATKTLEKYKTQMHNLENNYETLQAKTRGFSNEITKTTEALNTKGLEEYKANMIEVGQSFEDAGSKITKIGDGMQNVGEKITVMSAAVLGASYGIAQMYMDYETYLAKLNSIAKFNEDELNSVSQEIIELSNETGQTVVDIANAAYDAISSGVNRDKAVEFVGEMNKLSKSGFTELGKALDVVTTIINAYGLSVDDATMISDRLIQTQNLGKVTVDELASSMGKVIPTANAYGVNLDQLCTYLAESTSQGIACAEATTYVNSAFNELGDSGSTVGTILRDRTGKTFKELMESGMNLSDIMLILNQAAQEQGIQFSELWGSAEAGKAGLSILTNEGAKFNEVLGQMQQSSGATAEAFKTVSDTSKERLNKSINELKNSFLKMGEALTPLIDAVSKGISKVADAFSKLDPKVAANIVKFAALTAGIGVTLKVVGTFTSGIGSLVGGIGKGIKALANLITINSTTAAALSATGTATQGLTTSTVAAAGGFGGLSKAIGLLTNPITLAVGAIAGIGLAIYNTQKEMKENQKELDSMGNAYDDFTGRLKNTNNILGEVFGKTYEFTFSDNYKQALANSEADVQNWVERLKSYQTEIQNLLNDTQKTPEVKQEEMDQMLGTERIAEIATTSEVNPYANYLKETYGESSEFYDVYLREYENYIAEMKGKINANNDEIKAIIQSDMAMYGEISADGMAKITALQEDNAAMRVNIEKQGGEDITNILSAHSKQTNELLRDSNIQGLDDLKDAIGKKKQANEEYYNSRIEMLEKDTLLSEEQRRREEDNILAEMNAKKSQQAYMESFYYSMAALDKDYAEQNGYNTQKIIENGIELGYSVEDTATGVEKNYFNCEQSMQKWADSHGMSVTQIEGQNGKMVSVIQDGNGNIIGSVNSVADRYNLFATDIEGVMSKYTNAVNNGEMTTDQAMAAIQSDLAQGKISAEQFGMTDNEFYKVANAMLTSKGDADSLTTAINGIPTDKTVNISVNTYGAEDLHNLQADINNLPVSKTVRLEIQRAASSDIIENSWKYEAGGTVPFDQIAWTNENHRFELTSKPAYEIGTTSFGTLTALSGGTRVYNNTASVDMMKAAVQEEVARAASQVSLGDYYDRSTTPAIKLNNTLNPVISQSAFDSSNMEKLMNNMIGILTGILNKSNTIEINEKALSKRLAPSMDKELGRLR